MDSLKKLAKEISRRALSRFDAECNFMAPYLGCFTLVALLLLAAAWLFSGR